MKFILMKESCFTKSVDNKTPHVIGQNEKVRFKLKNVSRKTVSTIFRKKASTKPGMSM